MANFTDEARLVARQYAEGRIYFNPGSRTPLRPVDAYTVEALRDNAEEDFLAGVAWQHEREANG